MLKKKNHYTQWNSRLFRKVGLKRKNKYNAIRTNGYASRMESADSIWLRSLEKRGIISDLNEQVRFDFIINGKKLKKYARVDFQFRRNGKVVWYETKGMPTDLWLLKKDIIEATLEEGHIYMVNGSERDIMMV